MQGLLLPTDHEVEATLSFDDEITVRDTVWPLAWRLCLQPVISIVGEGAAEWRYRCYSSRTTITLRAEGDRVWVRRDDGPETAFLADELWSALVSIGEHVVALAERDLGTSARDVELLRPSLEGAREILSKRLSS